MQKSNLLLN